MSLSAAVLRELMAAGLTGDDLLAAVERIERAEGKPADALEKRRAYDRERKRTPVPYNSEDWWGLREAVIARDGGKCAYCDDHEGVTLTADHIIPLSRGGAHDERNLVCCCVPCNNSKRNLLLQEWPGRSTTRRHRPFDHLIGQEAANA